jgi:hypothetical protein
VNAKLHILAMALCPKNYYAQCYRIERINKYFHHRLPKITQPSCELCFPQSQAICGGKRFALSMVIFAAGCYLLPLQEWGGEIVRRERDFGVSSICICCSKHWMCFARRHFVRIVSSLNSYSRACEHTRISLGLETQQFLSLCESHCALNRRGK